MLFVTVLRYAMQETLASGAADEQKKDNLKAISEAVLAAYESGELREVRSFEFWHSDAVLLR